ncbi:unnamed protein product [Paramecium pentaurelia]|uniref:Transmembrane protein n=1 Tax=Paramecium pentaurelia TaxID=43138 RepID=A0A8S1WEP0_9CILI|nr:unnamed protein product [Paramecium pentaurelia]
MNNTQLIELLLHFLSFQICADLKFLILVVGHQWEQTINSIFGQSMLEQTLKQVKNQIFKRHVMVDLNVGRDERIQLIKQFYNYNKDLNHPRNILVELYIIMMMNLNDESFKSSAFFIQILVFISILKHNYRINDANQQRFEKKNLFFKTQLVYLIKAKELKFARNPRSFQLLIFYAQFLYILGLIRQRLWIAISQKRNSISFIELINTIKTRVMKILFQFELIPKKLYID